MPQLRWQEIVTALSYHANESTALAKEWTKIKAACQHVKLPARTLGEEYQDTCPDCGYVSYCYRL